jgi:hypothetical protein
MSGLENYLPQDMVQSIRDMATAPDVTQLANPSQPQPAPQAAPQAVPTPYMQPPSTLPGADAALQARVLQSLQNPNAGDAFMGPAMAAGAEAVAPPGESLLPGTPGELLAGAAVGSAFGLGMTAIANKWNGFERLATAVDKAPGIRQLSAAMEKKFANTKNAGLREWLMRDAMEKGAPTAIANMERRQLAEMSKGYAKLPEVKTLLSKHKTFAEAQAALGEKISTLENKAGKLTKEESKLLKAYRGAFQSIKGINNLSYRPLYAQQAAQMERLAAKGVGPIGRGIASMSLYTQRIFGGDTLKSMLGGSAAKAESGAGKWLSKLFPSALGGAFIFGSAIHKANNAKDGEKVSTFMHDFLGVGLGSLIGWEVGQKLLTAVGFRGLMDKVGNKLGIGHVANRLLTPGRGLLEKVFSPATITKITKFLPKLTFGGTAIGLISMFVFGGIFQKLFEKVSDGIFGKPSEASLNGQDQSAQLQAAMSQDPALSSLLSQQGYGAATNNSQWGLGA